MIRLALVGCGEHAEGGHAVPLSRYQAEFPGEIVLAAACDVHLERAQRLCRQYGFESAYCDYQKMLSEEKLDGCIVVVPPEQISSLSGEILRRGTPCVVEKPLGSSLLEARGLRTTAASSGTLSMVSVNRRFMPFLNRALEWTRSAGEVSYVHCSFVRHARREPEFLWATVVHAVDTLRYIAGNIRKYGVQIFQSSGPALWCAIDLHFKNGSVGRIDVLPTAGIAEETYDLVGEGFRTTITCPFGRERSWRTYRNGSLFAEETAADGMPEDVVNGCYDETKAFIHALRDGVFPIPSIEDVFPSVELCFEISQAVVSEMKA